MRPFESTRGSHPGGSGPLSSLNTVLCGRLATGALAAAAGASGDAPRAAAGLALGRRVPNTTDGLDVDGPGAPVEASGNGGVGEEAARAADGTSAGVEYT